MIPFFRKIRKRFADDNKPLKYMRYAIGEILLVVIGILIALQINSWNQDQLSNKTEKVILNRLVKDLEVDHQRYQRLDSLIKRELEMNKEFNSLIKKISFSERELLEISQFWGVSVREINPRLTTYEEMVNSGKIYTISNETLVNEIVEYYRKLKDVEIDGSNEGERYDAYWNSRDFIEFWHMKNIAGDFDEMKKIAEVLLIDKSGDDYKHLLNVVVRGQDIGTRLVRRNEDLKGKNANLRKNITIFLNQ